MNLAESSIALCKAREAFRHAWLSEKSFARRKRLRSILLKLDLEIGVIAERMKNNPDAVYAPVAGNFVTALHDLTWARNQAETFTIAPAERGTIVSWVASMIHKF